MDMVFPFVATFIDRATSFSASLRLTEVHTIYLDLLNALLI